MCLFGKNPSIIQVAHFVFQQRQDYFTKNVLWDSVIYSVTGNCGFAVVKNTPTQSLSAIGHRHVISSILTIKKKTKKQEKADNFS